MPRRSPTHSMTQLQTVGQSATQRVGGTITYHVFQLLRSAVQDGADHLGLAQVSEAFQQQLIKQTTHLETDVVELQVSAGGIVFNQEPLSQASSTLARADWVAHHLVLAGILCLRFRRGLDSAEIRHFSDRFAKAILHLKPIASLSDLPHVEIVRVKQSAAFETHLTQLVQLGRYPLLQLYAEGIARTLAWSQALNTSSPPDRVGPKRLVGQIVDALQVDPGGILGLTLLRPQAGSFSNRRFDTAVLVTGLALHMGLNDNHARELGVAALLRPLPAAYGPWWVREATPPEAAARVAYRAFAPLEMVTGFEACAPLGLLVDAAYYGESTYRHISTTLLTVAEAFVDLLQPDSSSEPFAPDIAMQMMIAGSGRAFDTEVVRALVHLLGLFPPGTAVQLNSGDLAVVTDAPSDGRELHRPVVRPLNAQNDAVFDLGRPELESYSIERSVPSAACPVNPIFVFLI